MLLLLLLLLCRRRTWGRCMTGSLWLLCRIWLWQVMSAACLQQPVRRCSSCRARRKGHADERRQLPEGIGAST